VVDSYGDADDLEALDALQLRNRVKEVWAFVLTHEGGPDKSYTYPNDEILVGETIWGTPRGNAFQLDDVIGGTSPRSWKNYRWKVHKMMVKPKNLM
jgi:hypothetical protein